VDGVQKQRHFKLIILALSKHKPYRCWMGMLNGYIKVVDNIEKDDMEA